MCRRLSFLTSFVLALALALPTTTQAANLLVNPGFEDATDFTGWTTWDGAQSSYAISAVEYYSGAKSAEFSGSLSNWNCCAGAYQEFSLAELGADIGSMVKFTGYAKATGTDPVAALKIIYRHANNFNISVDEVLITNEAPIDWTYGEVSGVIPAECASVRFEVAHFKQGTSFFDDVSAVVMPGKASNPSPTNEATDASTTDNLSWTAGSGATSHDVYFGTDSTPDATEFQGNQAGTTFDPGTMVVDTTYYWRIDEKNDDGTRTGDVWSFTVSATTVMEWVDDFPAIAISNITAQNSNPSASQLAELHTNGNANITADNTTTAQLSNGTDTLVTEYKLEFDGDGVSATGGSAVDWTAYDTFLSSAAAVTYYSGDEYVNVTLYARASNAADDVADAGTYNATQTLTVSWVGP